MRILLTGAAGFLGWHTRVRLRALTEHEIVPVTRDTWPQLAELAAGCDAILHVAGVNRGSPEEVRGGNVQLAEDIAGLIDSTSSVQRVVYANSIQAGADGPYGEGKSEAGRILAAAAGRSGATYLDARLPNLFGEGGRPDYNSFVATFVDRVVAGANPDIADRPIRLLHVQDAAQTLIDGLTTGAPTVEPVGTETSVQAVWDTLVTMKRLYDAGDIPPLLTKLDLALFNTLRWALFPEHYPIRLSQHTDDRGSLVETVRAHGGQGQTFVSTTHPGVTRGEHFHLEKVERFVVIGGRARISLRRVFTDHVIDFEVSGDDPVIVDMPTMWVHNITNTGDGDLTTLFWSHELFDPGAPDTFWEPVARQEQLA